ncbi:MAG TPA: iron-containing alcohol dehydrogenase, partial [Labilithrix sp.]|nr:iron-containing alcohol dehydrogenase [Labilithrix sp.]
MSIVTWSYPTTVVFGNGAVAKIGDYVRRASGKRALVVCDPGVVKAQIAERVQKHLESAGIAAMIFDRVEPNPVLANVTDGVAAYRSHGADIVVSVGGGSPLDVGKLIALKTTHERPLEEYDDAIGGDAHITSNIPPIINVPTTAGTGSEVGRSGVVGT